MLGCRSTIYTLIRRWLSIEAGVMYLSSEVQLFSACSIVPLRQHTFPIELHNWQDYSRILETMKTLVALRHWARQLVTLESPSSPSLYTYSVPHLQKMILEQAFDSCLRLGYLARTVAEDTSTLLSMVDDGSALAVWCWIVRQGGGCCFCAAGEILGGGGTVVGTLCRVDGRNGWCTRWYDGEYIVTGDSCGAWKWGRQP